MLWTASGMLVQDLEWTSILSKGTSSWQFMQLMLRICCSSKGKTNFLGSLKDFLPSCPKFRKIDLTVIGGLFSSACLEGDFELSRSLLGLKNIKIY
jgi:hypothetical protein